jgi:tetratricopeptide (TPR) repeat protein
MRSMIFSILFTLLLINTVKSQSSLAKYDSAMSLVEKAQLVPAVNLLQEIKDELYANKNFKEYFGAQYYFAVYYAIVDRNPQAAEDSLRLNLEKAIRIGGGNQSLEAAEMYFGLAWLADSQRNLVAAEENYKKALDIQQSALGAENKKVIKTKTNYAQVLTSNRKLGRAEKYLLEVLKAYPKIYEANHPEYVRLYTLAFNYYQATSEREKELSYALAALEIGKLNYGPTNQRMLSLLRNVSNAYFEKNNLLKAIDFANDESELVNILIGDAPHIRKAEIANNIGRFYDQKHEYEAAYSYYEKGLELKENLLGINNPSTLNTAINLTFVLNNTDRLSESSARLKSILTLLREQKVHKFDINYQRTMLSLVENLSLMGKRDTVLSIVNESFKTFQINMNSTLLSSDEHINALNLVENLSVLSNHQSAPTNELAAITEKIFWLDSINSETLKRMNLQSDQLTFLELYSVFNGVAIDHFFELYSRTSDEKYADEIVRFSEKNKATILSPEYAIARLKDGLNVPIEILEKERRLLSELYSDSKEGSQSLLEKKLSYDSLMTFLKTNYEDYYKLKFVEKTRRIAEIQNQIPDNSQLLSYALSEKHLYSIVISDSTFSISRQKTDSLAEHVIKFRENIVALEDIQKEGEKIFTRLIPFSPTDKKLIISTQEFISFVPFELLHNGSEYLGISNSISYTPSIEMWLNSLVFDPYSNTRVLAMAPDFSSLPTLSEDVNRDLLVPIPGAEQELITVKENFDGEFLYAKNATKNNFISKISGFGIIHLATHAIVNNDNPNLSRLYFTESEDGEEPFIHNYELYNLDVNANLVTLSACNTGLGEIAKGDGANSLARGFMYAGAPATLVSLWPASDKSTPELMKHFYQNLKDGQAKDVALNNARKQYLETATGKARHPFYWGGFVLIGDNSPIEEDRNLLVFIIPITIILVLIGTILQRKKRLKLRQ